MYGPFIHTKNQFSDKLEKNELQDEETSGDNEEILNESEDEIINKAKKHLNLIDLKEEDKPQTIIKQEAKEDSESEPPIPEEDKRRLEMQEIRAKIEERLHRKRESKKERLEQEPEEETDDFGDDENGP